MHGALTIQKFKADEQALLDAQIAMRGRIVAYVKTVSTLTLADSDLRGFAKLFNKLADEIAGIEPR
jgi:hypothetical protein